MQVELARGLDPGRHVGEPEVHRLVLEQRLAHALSLARVGKRGFERGAAIPVACAATLMRPDLEVRERDAVAHAFLRRAGSPPGTLQFSSDDLRGVGRALPVLSSIRATGSRASKSGTTNALMPFLPAPLSVTANTIASSAFFPEVMNCLTPFST
jgi:hypothetical protein